MELPPPIPPGPQASHCLSPAHWGQGHGQGFQEQLPLRALWALDEAATSSGRSSSRGGAASRNTTFLDDRFSLASMCFFFHGRGPSAAEDRGPRESIVSAPVLCGEPGGGGGDSRRLLLYFKILHSVSQQLSLGQRKGKGGGRRRGTSQTGAHHALLVGNPHPSRRRSTAPSPPPASNCVTRNSSLVMGRTKSVLFP